MLTNAELQAARELCESATPGPWKVWTSNSCRRITGIEAMRPVVEAAERWYMARDFEPACRALGTVIANYRSRKATP